MIRPGSNVAFGMCQIQLLELCACKNSIKYDVSSSIKFNRLGRIIIRIIMRAKLRRRPFRRRVYGRI